MGTNKLVFPTVGIVGETLLRPGLIARVAVVLLSRDFLFCDA